MLSSRFFQGVLTIFIVFILVSLAGSALWFWYGSPRWQALEDRVNQRLDRMGGEARPVEIIRVEREPAAPVIPSLFLQGRRSPVLPLVRRTLKSNEENVFTIDRQIGSLTALTVDGWLLGSASLFESLRVADVGVVWEGRIYSLSNVVRDTSTGFVYAKAALQNLPVVGFARSEDVVTGLPVWVEPQPGRVFPQTVVDSGSQIFQGSLPSERFTRRYVLNGGSFSPNGGAVWDASGQLVGLMDVSNGSVKVIPATFVAATLASLSVSNEIRRTTLGIHGFETSFLLTEAGQVRAMPRGFLVRTERARGITGVEPKGPSATALKEGDVLQKLDQDVLDATTELAYRLAQYRPGTRLTLYGERAGKPFQASVVLGSVVTSEVLK